MNESDQKPIITDSEFSDALGSNPKLDFIFKQFFTSPAMVAKKPINGHRMWTKYDSERYTPSEYEVVEDMWDHEHCSVCYYKIKPKMSYWENSEGHILCDQC